MQAHPGSIVPRSVHVSLVLHQGTACCGRGSAGRPRKGENWAGRVSARPRRGTPMTWRIQAGSCARPGAAAGSVETDRLPRLRQRPSQRNTAPSSACACTRIAQSRAGDTVRAVSVLVHSRTLPRLPPADDAEGMSRISRALPARDRELVRAPPSRKGTMPFPRCGRWLRRGHGPAAPCYAIVMAQRAGRAPWRKAHVHVGRTGDAPASARQPGVRAGVPVQGHGRRDVSDRRTLHLRAGPLGSRAVHTDGSAKQALQL